jgi:hypothetical protein
MPMPILLAVLLTNTIKIVHGSTSYRHSSVSAFSVLLSTDRIVVGRRPSPTLTELLFDLKRSTSKPLLLTPLAAAGAPAEERGGGERPARTGWLHRTVPRVIEQRNEKENIAVCRLKQEMIQSLRNHRIISQPTFYPSGEENRSIMITEHKISVPLVRDQRMPTATTSTDNDLSTTAMIDIFFTVTEMTKEGDEEFFRNKLGTDSNTTPQQRAAEYVKHIKLQNMEKGIIYLQGGPGFGAPAPISGISFASKSSWAGAAFSNGFQRIILMDPRGTGRSSPITKQTLEKKFPGLFSLDQSSKLTAENLSYKQSLSDFFVQLRQNNLIEDTMVDCLSLNLSCAVNYMSNFRADNIVLDAEAVKDALLLPPTDANEVRPWGAVLGQSFGGFCIMTYLSIVSNPPKICLLTGGIAPMLTPIADVYASLWERVKQRNLMYYDRYPSDIDIVKKIVRTLLDCPVKLPSGGNLTARRFLQLGFSFLGGSPSSFASLHNLLAVAFVGEDDDSKTTHSSSSSQLAVFSKMFLKQIDSIQPFDDHPIYFLLHESIYANGKGCSSTAWAAHTVYERLTKNPSELRFDLTSTINSKDRPTLFFGEMVRCLCV